MSRKAKAYREECDAIHRRDALRNAAMALTDAANQKPRFDVSPIVLRVGLSPDEAKLIVEMLLARAAKVGALTDEGNGVWAVNSEDDLVEAVMPYLN